MVITGSTGFLGSHVLRKMLELDVEILLIVRYNSREKLRAITSGFDRSKMFVTYWEKNWQYEMRKFKPHVVIHLASIRGEQHYDFSKYSEINVGLTEKLCQIAEEVSASTFLYCSTVGVHGTIPKKLNISESSDYNPDSKYHKSKMMAEKNFISQYTIPNRIIIRPTIIYGPGDNGFIYKMIKLIKLSIFPLVCGKTYIHLVSVDRVTEIIQKSLFLKGDYILFAVDDKPVMLSELINKLAKRLHKKPFFSCINPQIFVVLKKIFKLLGMHDKVISIRLISESWTYQSENLNVIGKLSESDTLIKLDHYLAEGAYNE